MVPASLSKVGAVAVGMEGSDWWMHKSVLTKKM